MNPAEDHTTILENRRKSIIFLDALAQRLDERSFKDMADLRR
jgi:16S rRNA G527 N7-methylase RsmG